MSYRLGVDVGGTFTDLLLVGDKSGKVFTAKVPSTPDDSSIGVLNGVAKVCKIAKINPKKISHVMHGTTVATNTADTGMPVRCHFHNTRNTGIANAQAALDAGVASLDASIGGIGGCPFAPAATGNIATDDLMYMLERSGIETGVSREKIIATSKWLEEQLGRSVPAMLPKAGGFPQGTGIRQTG